MAIDLREFKPYGKREWDCIICGQRTLDREGPLRYSRRLPGRTVAHEDCLPADDRDQTP